MQTFSKQRRWRHNSLEIMFFFVINPRGKSSQRTNSNVLFSSVSISSIYPGELVGWMVSWSATHTFSFPPVSVSRPSQSIRRPWDVIYFLRYEQQHSDFNFFCHKFWSGGGAKILLIFFSPRMVRFSKKIGSENKSQKMAQFSKKILPEAYMAYASS